MVSYPRGHSQEDILTIRYFMIFRLPGEFTALNFPLVFLLLGGRAGHKIRIQKEMKFFTRQMRSAYWPLWAVLLLIWAGSGCLKSENEKLKEEIVDVSAENEKLRRELETLKSDNSKMHMKVAQLHLEIAALHQEIQTLQKDLELFKAQLKSGDKRDRKL
jgi:septal ring factor EnvC (AmiA/AmiB activator)